jgi:hypothetical protein
MKNRSLLCDTQNNNIVIFEFILTTQEKNGYCSQLLNSKYSEMPLQQSSVVLNILRVKLTFLKMQESSHVQC